MQFTMHFLESHEKLPLATIVANSCRFQQNGIGGFAILNFLDAWGALDEIGNFANSLKPLQNRCDN